MYTGHPATALGLTSFIPTIPPSAIFIGVSLLDLFNGLNLLTGTSHVTPDPYPGGLPYMFFKLDFIGWDHSLLSAGLLSLGWGSYWFLKTRRAQERKIAQGKKRALLGNASPRVVGLVAGACVFFHWLEDWLVHNNDLALYPHSTRHFGCGLWGKMGIGAWVAEGLFCVPFVWYSWRQYSSRGASGGVMRPVMLLGGLWMMVSPWGSVMRWLAEADVGEVLKERLFGLGVLCSFLVPTLLLSGWTGEANRRVQESERRKRVD